MIKFTLVKRHNPMDPDSEEKAYAVAQREVTWDLEALSSHISSHNSKYNRADVRAVLVSLVDCMKELLLEGNSIQLGELGTFFIVLRSLGVNVEEATDYPSSNITAVRVGWRRGSIFSDLLSLASFSLVTPRAMQKSSKQSWKEKFFGTSSSSSSSSEDGSDSGSSSGDSGSADQGSSSSGNQEESSGG